MDFIPLKRHSYKLQLRVKPYPQAVTGQIQTHTHTNKQKRKYRYLKNPMCYKKSKAILEISIENIFATHNL